METLNKPVLLSPSFLVLTLNTHLGESHLQAVSKAELEYDVRTEAVLHVSSLKTDGCTTSAPESHKKECEFVYTL